jgi:hypothetical protein
MKNGISFTLGLCLLAGPLSVPLSAEPGAIRAKVPFEFVVAGKTLPAGEYRIVAVPHRVAIQDGNGKKLAVVLSNETSTGSSNKRSKLIFHCYSQECFLSEVWSPDYEHGQLVHAPSEEPLAKEESPKYVAVLGEKLDK